MLLRRVPSQFRGELGERQQPAVVAGRTPIELAKLGTMGKVQRRPLGLGNGAFIALARASVTGRMSSRPQPLMDVLAWPSTNDESDRPAERTDERAWSRRVSVGDPFSLSLRLSTFVVLRDPMWR
jgi:hypothetical protein